MKKINKNSFGRRARRWMESLSLRLFFGLLGRVPVAWHGVLARRLAAFYIRFFPMRRGVLLENLDTAFGAQGGAERRRLVRGIYESTILFALELARLRFASPAEVCAAVRMPPEDQAIADALDATGRGFLAGCAHHGNWEWMGAWCALTRGKFGVVYKPMHNPDSDAVARALRERFGITILSTRERVPRELFRLVRGGGMVAILADQDARREGRFLPFFGKPASTAMGLASLAVRLGVPIVPAFCLREGPGRFRIKLYPPLEPVDAAGREDEELRLTAAYLACIEDAIRLAPEQYFWWHRRWKTQPREQGTKAPV